MNFAQVCGLVTCAVMAFVGCGTDRVEEVGSEHDSPSTDDDHLVASPGAPTLHDGRAAEGSTTQAVGVPPITWTCQITITGPSTGLVGVPVHYSASSTCNPGTPEVQWSHRIGTGSFAVIQAYSTTTSLDYTATAAGSHQFFARVRAQGTTRTSSSNTLTATLSNVAPIAVADTLVVEEDHAGSVNVLANDSDANHDALTATLATGPASGTATIAAGVITYTPQANYHGSDAITYLANDGHGNTATGTLAITVNAVNDPPVAVDDALAVAEDGSGAIDVALNDSDLDGDALAIASITAPAHGTASFTGTTISYAPAADYNGADALQYTISDGAGGTATATLAITVAGVNDAPIAVADAVTTNEDTAASFAVVTNDSDVDGDALAIIAITAPAHGSATIIDATHLGYTPAANYHGADALSYTISDGNGGTATASVAITVVSVNDAPIAVADAAFVTEDYPATIDVVANDSDPDGDALAITSVTQGAHGTVTISNAHHVSYAPGPDYNGADAFSYTISDGHGGTATAGVAITVTSVDDPPVAVADAATVAEDGSVTIDVAANDSDVDGDALDLVSVTTPAHGSATIADAHHVIYTPAANYHGGDAFSYTIEDGSGAPGTATVTITVTSVNDAPIANADSATLDEDGSATVDVVANDLDVDDDTLTVTAVTQPAHGLASIGDGHHVTYTPAPDYHGPDAVTYTISDGNGGTATASLVLTVASVNDAPVAADDAGSLDEDTAVTVDVVANDADVDGDALTITSVTQPAHGTAALADGHHVTYTPAADYHGGDSFTYTISDGAGGTATATLVLTVISVNDAPVAVADTASLDEDVPATLDVVGNDTDVDGDALTVTSVTAPANGTAAIAGAHQVLYTPAANYHGGDSFTYTISDGAGGTASATVTLTVTSVNDAPVAASVAASTFDDTPVVATLSASDVDGDALSFAIVAGPAHGTLGAIVGDHVTYTPALGYVGGDSFTYLASDGTLSSAAATASLTVVKSVCGNGVEEGVHEECDDGNATSGDGCEATCKLTCGSGTGADRATVDAASGHCFAAYDGVQHSYQQAAALCGSLGGHLPTIGSASEDAAAFAAVHAGDHPWLGADDIAVEGAFHWTTGEAFAYTNFHASQPDNAGDADCVQYLGDGTWDDASCATTTGALCELELVTATPSIATGGSGTRGVTVADLNGDGFADLAVTHPASNTVGVLLGNGAGGFVLQATYATGTGPTAIASGDFNGDGHVDLAVVNATASTVTVLLGTAGGTFVTGATVAIAAGSTSISAADFDQDGTLDLAVGASGTIRILHGTGSGGFTAGGSISLLGLPASIAAGDFDHDGAIDLAVSTAAAVLVIKGTGGGAFGLPLSLAVTLNNRMIVAADLDHDGNLDLAVANGAATVSVFFGSALGVFGAATNLTVAGAPQLVVAGDFDGDGSADVVALTDNTATLFHGGAARTFTAAGTFATGGGGASAAVAANLNGDAAQDLVVANAATSTAGILLGGAGGLGGRAIVGGTSTTSTVTGDFNEDGRPDLAVIDQGASKAFVYTQTAGGALVLSQTVALVAGAGSSFAVVADFDGDHHADIAIANTAFSSVSVLLGTGTGTFGTPQNTGTAQAPTRLAVGDFNGDGRPDLAVPAGLGNAVSVLIYVTGGRFGRVADLSAGNTPAATVVGDFNGDGKQDIAVATTGEASVKLLLGHGDTTFAAPVAFAVAAGGQAIAAGDVDGDGKLDLIATCTATNNVSVLRGSGTGTFAAATNVATGPQPSAVTAVDLDGDGQLDLVVGNAGSNSVTVLHNDAAGGFVPFTVAIGGAPTWLTAVDLDRDGHLDVVATTASSIVTTLFSGR
jgi:large repetitive protein